MDSNLPQSQSREDRRQWPAGNRPWLRSPLPLPLAVLLAALVLEFSLGWAAPAWAAAEGAVLFRQHCVGCHVNGGNVIRRGRTLRVRALSRAGLNSPKAIAAIAAEGIGQMDGYSDRLGRDGAAAVGVYVWEQAQAGWPRG
ncbi:MAG: cytochrome C6 [Aphanocapsa feldmannii 277cV]|uniref:Cytochrome C6 n=2 Tax=Aphanocapsa feldmannii TaxID=192050 RepID=A0A524RNW0_9CHRO|nr:MAG: cytochrome C6 [Aphanocapsa feldmannii 277cV]TGH26852.1 MAG: cytochrome C6 [Aphanocapsa feldmannii 277cI]